MKKVTVRFVNCHPRAHHFTKHQTFGYEAPDYTEVGDLVSVPTKQGTKVARVVGMGSTYPGKLREIEQVFKEVEQPRTRVRIKPKEQGAQ